MKILLNVFNCNINVFTDIKMDLIKKLVRDINAKDEENMLFEREKHELQDDVESQEQCINKKIKILEMHLEQKKQYGTKLQRDISDLKNKMEILSEQEKILDMVC